MIREQDRPALRRLISSAFAIENEYNEELTAIANGEDGTGTGRKVSGLHHRQV